MIEDNADDPGKLRVNTPAGISVDELSMKDKEPWDVKEEPPMAVVTSMVKALDTRPQPEQDPLNRVVVLPAVAVHDNENF